MKTPRFQAMAFDWELAALHPYAQEKEVLRFGMVRTGYTAKLGHAQSRRAAIHSRDSCLVFPRSTFHTGGGFKKLFAVKSCWLSTLYVTHSFA